MFAIIDVFPFLRNNGNLSRGMQKILLAESVCSFKNCSYVTFLMYFLGFINTILSWKVFIPLGRLTYCAYLVHPIIQYYYYGSRKELQYWDDHEIVGIT